MDSSAQEASVLIEVNDVQWFRLLDNNRQRLAQGVLRVCCLKDQNVCYLNLEDFYVPLSFECVVIAAEFNTHKAYIIQHVQQGFIGFTVALDEAIITQLEIIISNNSVFLRNRAELSSYDANLLNSVSHHCVNIFDVPLIDDDQALHYIKKGGSLLKEGFMWFGKNASTHLNKAGEYFGSKITSQKKVEISQESKDRYKNIKDTTKTTLQITGSLLSQILTPVVKTTSQFVDDLSKKIDEGDNETLKKIKKVGGATIDATSVAFEGLSSGAAEVGKSIGNNTRNLIEKKYGDDITTTITGSASSNTQSSNSSQKQHQLLDD